MNIVETSAEIDAAAAEWVARLASGEATPADRRMLDAWLARSDHHHGAYVRARALWAAIGVQAAQAPAGAPREDTADEGEAAQPRFSRRGLIAAGIAATFAGSFGVYYTARSPITRVATDEGEQRRLPLGPGRSVLLNTQSAIAMSCASGTCGPVELVRGEALFSAMADAGDALIVECRDMVLESLNGLFAVAIGNSDTRITVVRGMVRLFGEDSRSFGIGAGRQAIVAQGAAKIRAIDGDELGRAIAWSTGYLVFAGETVAKAVAMMNRYNRLKIGIGRGVPAQEALVGRFSINDPQGFADAVAAIYGLMVRRVDGRLVLEAAAGK